MKLVFELSYVIDVFVTPKHPNPSVSKKIVFEKRIESDMTPNINESVRLDGIVYLVKNKIIDFGSSFIKFELRKYDRFNHLDFSDVKSLNIDYALKLCKSYEQNGWKKIDEKELVNTLEDDLEVWGKKLGE